jgi:hypothetical protein
VFGRLGQKSIFSGLGSRILPDNIKIRAPDQRRKKRRTARRTDQDTDVNIVHFSVNTISISYDSDQDTDVNIVQDDLSLPNQTHVINTNKNNGRKRRPPKKINPECNSREWEDNNDNLDALENEDDDEVRAKVPLDEIEILKGHIEA